MLPGVEHSCNRFIDEVEKLKNPKKQLKPKTKK